MFMFILYLFGCVFVLMLMIRNTVIRKKININISMLDYVRYKLLNWYGHVRIMNEKRLSQKMLEWCPPGRRRRRKRRPRNSLMLEVKTVMKEKGIANIE